MPTRPSFLALRKILHDGGTIRIPVSGSIPFHRGVRTIVDTSVFQRLRGVKQLGPTCLVFPGATHTRFEHSLGTYALALRYVSRFTEMREFARLHNEPDYLGKLIILTALLHDIGHYPFSHLIEEIGPLGGVKLEHHEKRAQRIIYESDIARAIERDWGVNPKDVCAAIANGPLKGGLRLAKDVINSVIDLDKLDYLIRDSIHCGVPYGKGIDTERFLLGLHIDPTTKTLCLTTKAQSHLFSLLTTRNMMYQDVYWHKTVRAFTVMLKTLIAKAVTSGLVTSQQFSSWVGLPDELFIHNVADAVSKANRSDFRKLALPFVATGRAVYKEVFTYNRSEASELFFASEFFDSLFKTAHNPPFHELAAATRRLVHGMRIRHGKLKEEDVLIEVTPVKAGHESYSLNRTMLWDPKKNGFKKRPYDLQSVDSFLTDTRRAFVFCHPEVRSEFGGLNRNQWTKIFTVAANEPT